MEKTTLSWCKSNIIDQKKINEYQNLVSQKHQEMHEYLVYPDSMGWLDLVSNYKEEKINEIEKYANKIKRSCDFLLVIGIGGSYLASRSLLEIFGHNLESYMFANSDNTKILFLGNNLSGAYWQTIMNIIGDRDLCVNVISKSGSTLEVKLAFSFIEKYLLDKYDISEVRERIYITSEDKNNNSLLELAKEKKYKVIYMEANIGGRYSLFTSVGMLPAAVANVNIRELIRGAKAAYNDFKEDNLNNNSAYQYAVIRNILYKEEKDTEVLVTYDPRFKYLAEWWKQLFAESEGKEGKGILPIHAEFTTDLHSFGQYIQEGRPHLFETILWADEESSLARVDQVNKIVQNAVYKAHTKAGIVNLELKVPQINEFNIGYLIYFFQKACAMSALILGVNPFNQPGVEAYKNELKKLDNSNFVL